MVLDTNIVSYLMKGHSLADRYRPLLEGHTLAISFMTVGELFEGAFRAGWGQRKIEKLELVLKTYVVIPSSPRICRLCGKMRCDRRHSVISPQDAWIAASALGHGCALATHNARDFKGIEGLELITIEGLDD